MGSRHEFSEDVANFHWGTGTWTDLFYHGHGTISVGASAYQSEAVKLWSDYRVRYIEMGFSAWGVFLSGCADSSSIDVYGLARAVKPGLIAAFPSRSHGIAPRSASNSRTWRRPATPMILALATSI